MAKKHDELLGHAADNDGIDEYDNPLPDWWMGLFLGSVVVAVIYPFWYQGMGNTQTEVYEREMAAAQIRWPKVEAADALPDDPATLAAGAETFAQICSSCHNADMTGGIGPNLIDATWIHGSEPKQVLATITDGVLEKGMPGWGAILGPAKVEEVAAYVISRRVTPDPTPAPEAAGEPVGDPAQVGEGDATAPVEGGAEASP